MRLLRQPSGANTGFRGVDEQIADHLEPVGRAPGIRASRV